MSERLCHHPKTSAYYTYPQFEIYDRRTGETIRSGYTYRRAQEAIAWCWNTGGETEHLGIRRTGPSA